MKYIKNMLITNKGNYLFDENLYGLKRLETSTFASQKLVKFSFDVYAVTYENEKIKDKKLILADKWFDLGTLGAGTLGVEDYKFIVPIWVTDNVEGNISIRVVAENIPEEYETTVNDMMGKIALIVRPGDDERWGYENLEFQEYEAPFLGFIGGQAYRPCYNPLTLFSISSITNDGATSYVLSDYLVNEIPADLKDNMLVIKDWGMDSWDSWHRRFGEEYYYYYATTATNYDKITDAKRTIVSKHKYEDQLLGGAAPEGAPTERKYYYDHAMSNGATAYIQDMVRVVKEKHEYKRTNSITVTWEESLNEKKNAIAGLFQEAVKSKDAVSNNIYINNLSGYFITTGHEVSLYPCYDYGTWGNYFSNSGKGGDYKDCANTLTPYVYGILSGSSKLSDGTKLAEGPWGLVMMDYIGTATSSQNLTNLIMLNNFSFSLNQKQDVNPAAEMRVELSDEKISPELNILVNWD